MKLLALDTSTSVAGVALMEGDRLICEYNLRTERTHSQRLMPMIDEALKMAEWDKAQIDVLSAVTGPGSFTGLRIGIATVKGMALALGKPTVGVGTLELLAAGFPYAQGILLPLCDARRAQVYAGAYDYSQGTLRELIAPRAQALTELMEEPLLKDAPRIICCGDGSEANAQLLQNYPNVCIAPPQVRMQRAACAVALAMEKALRGETLPAGMLNADYRRASQAEQLREARGNG